MEDEDGELQTESTSLTLLKENDNEKSEITVNNEQMDGISSTDIVPISPKKLNGDVEVKSVDNLKDNDDVGCSDVVNSNRLECLLQNDVQSSPIDNKVTNIVKINKKSEVIKKKVKKHLLKPFTKKLIKRNLNNETLPLTKKIRKIKRNDHNSIERGGEFSRSFLNNNKQTHLGNEVDNNQKTKRKFSNNDADEELELKKRILIEPLSESNIEIQEQISEPEDKIDSDEGEEQNSQLTEYAQYLGLQPTVKFKCYKCDESGFPTMQALQNHQDTCLRNTKKGSNKPPTLPSSISDTPSTNIRITRKVYLCSVCGTYYENWNLFLHMREVHRRYICLLCLGMFSEPDNLAVHLTNKHGVTESTFSLPEDFFSEYTGSCFLMCCTCDRVFSEDEEFFEHECIPVNRKLKGKSDTPCSLCGIKGNHQPNCRKSPFNIAQRQAESQQNKKEQNRKKLLKKNIISDTKINLKENDKLEDEIILPSVEIKQSEKGDIEIEADNYINTELIDTSMSMLENIVGTVPELSTLQMKDEKQLEHVIKTDEKIKDVENKDENINKVLITPSSQNNNTLNSIFEDLEGSTLSEEHDSQINNDELKADEEKLNEPDHNGINQQNESNQINIQEQSEIDSIQIAGQDMIATELILDETLSVIPLPALLKASIRITARTCVYCNHAKKIAVNGKQLALHLLAEHRLSPILQPEGEVAPDQYITRLKLGLGELQNAFFNSDTYDNTNKELCHPDEKVYECFHCHYVTPTQKDLYLHNRKMHQKTILLCIMCKTNFYSYSELLCHLCPGIYDLDSSAFFRCCVCAVDSLPSAFRLMVHLRKRHHACDVCLEITEDQQKLSNHVWKHKLHHLCYRCGIAYRNKPDITKHLFWKHGTESVLCKKCLQKKWPHVYHFCIPPNVFACEECNATFSRAVALKVHKRLHVNDTPYSCSECNEKFISKKLLARHEEKHRPPKTPPPIPVIAKNENQISINEEINVKEENESKENNLKSHDSVEKSDEREPEKKSKVDVYNLPPLNLSSESDDSEDEAPKKASDSIISKPETSELENKILSNNSEEHEQEHEPEPEPEPEPAQIVEGIWDNFKNYKANLERRESQNGPPLFDPPEPAPAHLPYPLCTMTLSEVMAIIIHDHDYLGRPGIGPMIYNEEEQTNENQDNNKTIEPLSLPEPETTESIKQEINESNKKINEVNERPSTPQDQSSLNKKVKSPKKRSKRSASSSSSDSSSNSDSSSCSCGTNCSCSSTSSSSSGSSSDSSDSDSSSSEGRRRQQERREKRRDRMKKKQEDHQQQEQVEPENSTLNNEDEPVNISLEEQETPIRESELDTDETDTDEDFYDKHPQMENKFLAEKRNKLLLLAGAVTPTVNNGAIPNETPIVPLTSSLPTNVSIPQPETPVIPTPSTPIETSSNKRKYRTKKRRKGQGSRPKLTNLIQPPLAADYQNDDSNPVTQDYFNIQALAMAAAAAANPSPIHLSSPTPVPPNVDAVQNTSSNSENDSGKRLSKRKRVPKRFYGDSSDEEANEKSLLSTLLVAPQPQPLPQPPPPPPPPLPPVTTFKWRKVIPPTPILPSPPPPPPISDPMESYSESSSSEGSDSECDPITSIPDPQPPPPTDPPPPQKNESLYCYCQCPYDEVSEMIACDGKDCTIEWFHFECVGIMVPPKGKWFCPDCRKRSGSSTTHHTHY